MIIPNFEYTLLKGSFESGISLESGKTKLAETGMYGNFK